MPERILVCVAWPYANGSLHIGQFVGAYLPADIYARYHRTAGNEVLMVSGSDQHGTPITVRAEQEGRTPAEVAADFHAEFLDTWRRTGVSFDLFTTTGTENHYRITQEMFLKLLEIGGNQFLYNLKLDPGERRTLAAEYPDLFKQLQAELKAWLDTEVKPR